MIPRGKPSLDDIESHVMADCLENGTLAIGLEVELFEQAMLDYHQMKYGVATSNGWAAIFLALKALDIVGREVIIPTTVCKSVWYAIVAAGCYPVLVDCNMEDFNVAVEDVEAKINPNTGAIIVPHLRGIPSDLTDLVALVKEGRVDWPKPPYLIEDCAQAIGARFNNKLVGTYGDVGIFSFYPTKIMTSIDGGMLITDHEWVAKKARDLRYQKNEDYFLPEVAYNFKMNNVNAAVGRVQLAKLDDFIGARWRVYKKYVQRFGCDDIYSIVAKMHPHKRIVPDKYMVVSDEKFHMEHFHLKKVMQLIKTVHQLHREFYASGYKTEEFPRAEAHKGKVISFPIYVGLQDEDIDLMYEVANEGRDTST